MPASLIIPFYKDIPALELILLALNKQSVKDFEVIIAEDDNALETVFFLQKKIPELNFSLQHISQEDLGYRRARALNNGIKIAKNDFIIFMDGDCIPHKHYIKEYIKEKEEKKILYGRRVNLSENFSRQLRTGKSLIKLNMVTLAFTESTRVIESFYLPFYPQIFKSKRQLWGCNMGVLKKHLLEVNGFDEDYAEYGYEDIDIYWRLNKSGCQLKSVKYQAIVYHLYHPSKAASELMDKGKIFFDQKVKDGFWQCKNGLQKL
ncbi:MAG: glycosyltransferase [Ferruginibacter sp.]